MANNRTKIKFSYISDLIFVVAVSYVSTYAVAIFYSRKVAVAIPAAALTAAISVCAYLLLVSVKNSKKIAAETSDETICRLQTAIAAMPKEKREYFALKTLKKADKKYSTRGNEIFIEDYKLVFAVKFPQTDADEIFNALSLNDGNKIIIFALNYTETARAFAKSARGIKLVDLAVVYPFISDDEELLNYGFTLKREKPEILKSLFIFDRKKARKTALYGLILLFTSRFTIYPIWYIISGAAFLIYSLIQVFFAKRSL